MKYRNILKLDPFEVTRRNIQQKLIKIEESILEKFPEGSQKIIMRRIIRQAVQSQPTTQAKIKRLYSFIDDLDYIQTDTTALTRDKSEPSFQDSRYGTISRQSNMKDAHFFHFPMVESENIRRSIEGNKSMTEKDESISSLLNYSEKRGQMENSKKFSPEISKNYLSYKYPPAHLDSVNQNDIFSFRTQKESISPKKHLKESYKDSIQKEKFKKSKKQSQKNSEFKLKRSTSKSISLYSSSKSKSKSKSNFKSNSNSKSKSNSRSKISSKKPIDYDGYSQQYSLQKSKLTFTSRVSNKNSFKEKSIIIIDPNSLFKRINNRIKYSSCVVDRIKHSAKLQNVQMIQKRHQRQSQTRKELAKQIFNHIKNNQTWK